MRPRKFAKLIRAESGAVALEFAIVSMAMVLVSLGVVEFGRALEVRNQLTFLADKAARQILNDSSVTDAEVEADIRAKFDGPNPQLLEVVVEQDLVTDSDGAKYRNVEVSYPFTLLIPQLSTSTITLTATERVPET
jgi:Flp pilus assembly protein TadG